jgi:uncharacterized membrane protein
LSDVHFTAQVHPAGVSLAVLAVVVLAGVLHAGWNAAAHAITDRMAAQLTIAVAYTFAAVPVAVLATAPRRGAWPFIVASALMHLLYTAQLMRSYRLGDFGHAYPVARAVAPVIVTAYSVALLGERPTWLQWIGLALLCAGIAVVAVARPPGSGRPSRAATLAAVTTGLCIAVYTLIDAVGVRYGASVAGYVGWMFLLQGPADPGLPRRRGPSPADVGEGAPVPRCRPRQRGGVLRGLRGRDLGAGPSSTCHGSRRRDPRNRHRHRRGSRPRPVSRAARSRSHPGRRHRVRRHRDHRWVNRPTAARR